MSDQGVSPGGCFRNAAYWFFTGLWWQIEIWHLDYGRFRLLRSILGEIGWQLDDLRLRFAE